MRLFLFLILCSFMLACSDAKSEPDPGAPPTSADRLRGELERRMDTAAASGFSGTALVTVGGQKLLAKAYGLADQENNVPNGIDTAFDVGSILKAMTSTAIFKLAGEGKLALTDPLSTFFDDVPDDKSAITVLQIVQHRAGFDAYHDEDEQGDFTPMTRLEARKRIFAQELLFEPGAKEEYSNSGYTLLADIIEAVSGRPFTDYVREQLLAPAHMQQSGFYGDPTWQHVDTAIGYGADTFESNDPAKWPYTWALVGNGGLVSTVSDLERWVVAFWGGQVLAPAALEAYRTQNASRAAAVIEGKTVYGFAGGGDFGLGGVVVDCPEANTRVILAWNDKGRVDAEGLAAELERVILSWK